MNQDEKQGRPATYYIHMILLALLIVITVVVILGVVGFIAYGISTDRTHKMLKGVNEKLSSNKVAADPEIEVIPIKRPYEK